MTTKVLIGLDVHKNSIVTAYALSDGSESQSCGKPSLWKPPAFLAMVKNDGVAMIPP